MKITIISLFILAQFSFAQTAQRQYPLRPIQSLTPGELCSIPSSYRYPEGIAYCERNVTFEQKAQIFAAYRRQGFYLSQSDRSHFKIDHFIPLCAGGSNSNLNLWPQHVSLYTLTDPLEELGCKKMAEGRISQARFVQLIKRIKNDLTQIEAVTRELNRL